MLTNNQVMSLVNKADIVRNLYDLELENYTRKYYDFPYEDYVICDLANKAFSKALNEDVNASVSEMYNYFSIIDRQG